MEEQTKKSKKKLWIVLASLAIVVIIGLGVTVGVLAAAQVNVSNTINVSYTSVQVAVDVSGTYQVHGDASATDFETSTGATTISFDGSEDSEHNTGSFVAVNNITLTAAHPSVVFVYTFTNNGGNAIVATCTLPSTRTNIAVTETDGTDPIVGHQLTIAAGATETYVITVAVDNIANNASFAGDFGWAIVNA